MSHVSNAEAAVAVGRRQARSSTAAQANQVDALVDIDLVVHRASSSR